MNATAIKNVYDLNGIKLKEGDIVYLNNLKGTLFTVKLRNDTWRLINKDFNLDISNLQFDYFKLES